MKQSIFSKLIIIFLTVSIVPTLISGFSIISSYEVIINKYFPEEKEFLRDELLIAYDNIKIQAILLLLLILFLVVLVSLLVSRQLIVPLKEILRCTREVSQGNMDVKVKVKTKDEMEELANSFNKMMQDLKKFHSALEENKAVLEIKVAAKTRELRELARALEKRVEERTRNLQDKMAELERFNKLTIGREMKMVELKKEIKKLKEKLKEDSLSQENKEK
jgi:HAMP domain-containing protein